MKFSLKFSGLWEINRHANAGPRLNKGQQGQAKCDTINRQNSNFARRNNELTVSADKSGLSVICIYILSHLDGFFSDAFYTNFECNRSFRARKHCDYSEVHRFPGQRNLKNELTEPDKKKETNIMCRRRGIIMSMKSGSTSGGLMI